jgi:hypothetical protein
MTGIPLRGMGAQGWWSHCPPDERNRTITRHSPLIPPPMDHTVAPIRARCVIRHVGARIEAQSTSAAAPTNWAL